MITTIYHVTGITCEACQYKVNHVLSQIEDVMSTVVDLETGMTYLSTQKKIPLSTLQKSFEPYPKYKINALENSSIISNHQNKSVEEEKKTWFLTYKPILLIFGYILMLSFLIGFKNNQLDFMLSMQVFMGGFFIIFSFFKMLNLKSFAESYSMYDIVAKKLYQWGYIYPFIELGLGIAYIIHFQPFITNIITLIVMSVSIIGVLESVMNKKKIRCACLGSVFNLPMSTVTIIEDGLMILMSVIMLFLMA